MAEAKNWLQKQAILLLVSAALLLAVFETMPLDLSLQRLFYDPVLGDFPWRHNWLLADVLHTGARELLIVLGLAALGVALLGTRGRLAWLPRRNAWLAATGLLVIPLGISALKALTNRHCPWDVIDFGGYAPYVGLLAIPPDGINPGGCFPAGHASAGFTWLIWGVALRPYSRRLANGALLAGLLLGGLLGGVQMLRGAHFLSHTLWSAWFAWAVCIALAVLFGAELRSQGGPSRQAAAGQITKARVRNG